MDRKARQYEHNLTAHVPRVRVTDELGHEVSYINGLYSMWAWVDPCSSFLKYWSIKHVSHR